MLTLGIFAVIQVLFLPGALAYKFTKLKSGILQTIIYVVGLSMVANYAIVFLLTELHLYLRPAVFVILVIEIGAIIYLYRGIFTAPIREGIATWWKRIVGTIEKILNSGLKDNPENTVYALFRSFALLVAFYIAIASILHMFQITFQNYPSVFNTYDAIVKWNFNATDWAQNRVPPNIEDYPQLGPILFSLTYVFIGSLKVQFFAKFIMPLFLLMIMLMMFDLGLVKPSYGLLFGVEIVYLVIKHFVGEYILDGYMDIPLAFFTFLGIYALLKSRVPDDERSRLANIFLGVVFLCGAAVTKQAGLYVLAVYPILVILLYGRKSVLLWWKEYRIWLISAGIIVLVLVVGWYGMKFFEFSLGESKTHLLVPIQNTTDTYGSQDLWTKIRSGVDSLGMYALGFLFILPALFLVEPAIRWIVVLIVLPYSLLWAGYASYDLRNLTLVWPFFSLAVAASLEAYCEWLFTLGKRIFGRFQFRWWVAAVVALLLVIAVGVAIPSSTLIQKQEALQKQILNPELNQLLYDYFESNPSQLKILASYPVEYLPGFEGRVLQFGFNNLPDFEWALDQGNIGFLLVPNYAVDEVRARIKKGVESGEFTLVFTNDKYVPEEFYIVNR